MGVAMDLESRTVLYNVLEALIYVLMIAVQASIYNRNMYYNVLYLAIFLFIIVEETLSLYELSFTVEHDRILVVATGKQQLW